MKAKEIREGDKNLAELENELTKELWKARFDNHSNQLDDTDKIRRLRRDIARVKTINTQRSKNA